MDPFRASKKTARPNFFHSFTLYKYSMNHYCVYTRDIRPGFISALNELSPTDFEMHLNRTRFWLDPSLAHHVEFYIKWSHIIHAVDPRENLATGRVEDV